MARVALITGAFSGVGQVTARAMARAGWTVYASGRSLAKGAELASAAQRAGVVVHPIQLDVTDEQSIAEAMAYIERESGRLDVLVNNAGLMVYGAVTEASNAQLRQEFETNTIGAVAVSRAALLLMHRNGGGRIINVSSVGGRVAFPGTGVYSASKFALEALSDAMRLEVKLIGPRYHVIVIEMPTIKTQLADKAQGAEYGGAPRSLYGNFHRLAHDGYRRMHERAPGPEVVVKAILAAATAERPKPRYVVTAQAKAILALRRCCPDWAFDRVIMALTPRLKQAIKARSGDQSRRFGSSKAVADRH